MVLPVVTALRTIYHSKNSGVCTIAGETTGTFSEFLKKVQAIVIARKYKTEVAMNKGVKP